MCHYRIFLKYIDYRRIVISSLSWAMYRDHIVSLGTLRFPPLITNIINAFKSCPIYFIVLYKTVILYICLFYKSFPSFIPSSSPLKKNIRIYLEKLWCKVCRIFQYWWDILFQFIIVWNVQTYIILCYNLCIYIYIYIYYVWCISYIIYYII